MHDYVFNKEEMKKKEEKKEKEDEKRKSASIFFITKQEQDVDSRNCVIKVTYDNQPCIFLHKNH